MIVAQFVVESKTPIIKYHLIRTVYQNDLTFDDGYVSDYTTNTQNSEGTYVLPPESNANSVVYDTTESVNSNGKIDGSQYDLNVNAAAAIKQKVSCVINQNAEEDHLEYYQSHQKCLQDLLLK